MLTQPQVQRYSAECGLRDLMIAEKEVVLTFLLQLLSERGILDRLAFKGGTCLRKMFVGSQGRFSTDLDFTGIEEHDHEEIILDMMQAFEQPFHGIQFAIPDDSYYETQDGLSWGVNPTYSHDWNSGGREIKIQISRRETPTLPTERRPQIEQSYFSGQGPLAALGSFRDQVRRSLAPRQSATGEINLPSTRGPKELLTTRHESRLTLSEPSEGKTSSCPVKV
jgi:Nucleotidyl transferase AbiEii toxin, Type IV TA system